ncbi:hypothetical protein D3C81_1952500 [compost metagenome]
MLLAQDVGRRARGSRDGYEQAILAEDHGQCSGRCLAGAHDAGAVVDGLQQAGVRAVGQCDIAANGILCFVLCGVVETFDGHWLYSMSSAQNSRG